MHNDDVASNPPNEPVDQSITCDYPGCAISAPHYHRETPDGEEIVRAEPRNTKSAGYALPFTDSRSVEEIRQALRISLHDAIGSDGGDSRISETMDEIEQLARRIAVDLLASTEFSHRLVTFIKAYRSTLFNSTEFQEAFETKFDAMFQYAFERRFGAAVESKRFKAKVMDVANQTAFGQLTGHIEEMHDPDGCIHQDRIKTIVNTPEFHQKVMDIVGPKFIEPADVPEEIVEIDEAGNVTAVESTVHTKPTLDHAQIAELPCDVSDE